MFNAWALKWESIFLFFFFVFFYLLSGDRWHILLKVRSAIENYFSEEDSPFNIAIFRIIFFLFILKWFDREKIVWFSQLPADLKSPPVGMHYVLSIVPITPDLAQKVSILFIGFSFLAMVGFFARAASFLAAISGIYVLGIPQFYGKVDHYHHLIWFMLILSASRCSDVLSIDSIGQAFREADQGRVPNNQNSAVYALPLRFIWLLIGMIYFFPGFWKVVISKGYWAWSDNLKYQMYASWHELGGWLPFFRLDQHPLLYKICGSGVMCFELSFVFLILFPVLRPMAAMAGILFHTMIGLFMQIGFVDLQICYVSFVNWAGLFAKIGKWIFKRPFYVRYNESPKSYQRMISVLVKFDIFQRIIVSDQIQTFEKNLDGQPLLKSIGVTLLLINSIFGFEQIMSGWPFACYPTFAGRLYEARIETMTAYGVIANKEEKISFNALKQRMADYKFAHMIEGILAMPDESQKKSKLKALVFLMRDQGIDLSHYSKVRFYKILYSTDPEKANDPPISKELLEEVNI